MKKLLIGCYGWDYDLWSPQFYPEELPPSWRFCFYSNEIRSVLVPWAVLSRATAEQISTWVEESDDGFEFVLEISGAPSADESDRLCVLSAPLAGRISAWTCSDPGASATGDSIARLAPVGHAQIAA